MGRPDTIITDQMCSGPGATYDTSVCLIQPSFDLSDVEIPGPLFMWGRRNCMAFACDQGPVDLLKLAEDFLEQKAVSI